jgi:hypothetical protein
MASFCWNIDDEPIEIIFSLCRNGRWIEREGRRLGIFFDYLDYEDIMIARSELEDLGEAVEGMLLQVLNLQTT